MHKKLVIGLLVVAAALLTALGLWTSGDSGSRVPGSPEAFFAAIQADDVEAVFRSLNPKAQEETDRPVLSAWMAAVRQHLGELQSIDYETSPPRSSEDEGGDLAQLIEDRSGKHVFEGGGVKLVHMGGKAQFSKASAWVSFQYVNGRLVEWSIRSKALPADWVRSLEDISLYDARSRRFLSALMNEDLHVAKDEASYSLSQRIDGRGMKRMILTLRDAIGPDGQFHLVEHGFSPEAPTVLIMEYRARSSGEVAESGDGVSLAVFWRFGGMTAELMDLRVRAAK